MRQSKPVVVDLFCGAGGMSTGFKEAGFSILWSNEFEEKYCKTYSLNHKNTLVKCGDIRNISSNEIKKSLDGKEVDVIIGGPPCQGFSHAGRRDPTDPRNSLFMEFIRIIKDLQPKWVVIENVPGILSMKTAKGEYVKDIIKYELEHTDGYKVKYFKLLAANYGVPQKRKRVFFIATNTGKTIEEPKQTHAEHPTMTLDGKKIQRWVPVKQILLSKEKTLNFFHTPRMIEGFVRRKERNLENGKGFGAQYLQLEKPSYTISARYWKDGSDALVRYSDDEIRMLTPEECAAIQTFPPKYKFYGSKRDVYTQIGNAVPVKLAMAVAQMIKSKL